MVSLIGLIIAGSILFSIRDFIRGDFRFLGSYGPYKAFVEYEMADDPY